MSARTRVAPVARTLGPIGLGLLLLGYALSALVEPSDPGLASDIYTALVLVSIFSIVALTGLFVAARLGQRPIWRMWLTLLGATVLITALGIILQQFALSQPQGASVPSAFSPCPPAHHPEPGHAAHRPGQETGPVVFSPCAA